MATALRDHKWRWEPDGGYYTVRPDEYAQQPRLPDFSTRRDRDVARLFDAYLPRDCTPEVLELGCGASAWGASGRQEGAPSVRMSSARRSLVSCSKGNPTRWRPVLSMTST